MLENTLPELYQSAVDAFPGTTKRQHVTDPIEISGIRLTPFLGMKTLLVRATATNEGRQYSPVILCKRVTYANEGFSFVASDDEKTYHIVPQNHNVLVRCNCNDFHWRFNYYNNEEQSLHGRVRAEYENFDGTHRANPKEFPGMCKHLMKMVEVLREMGAVI